MESETPKLPPGMGAFRPEEDERFDPANHLHGWNIAIQNALDNFGRAPGRYSAELVLTATVRVENPGNIVEYCAKFH